VALRNLSAVLAFLVGLLAVAQVRSRFTAQIDDDLLAEAAGVSAALDILEPGQLEQLAEDTPEIGDTTTGVTVIGADGQVTAVPSGPPSDPDPPIDTSPTAIGDLRSQAGDPFEVESADGELIQRIQRDPARRFRLNDGHRGAIMEGLRAAASAPGGTSSDVFKGFPIPVAGKTGTAEKGAGRPDQSWYLALAPYPNPKYVVAVTDEAGGFGAETAAPMARRILAELFNVQEEDLVQGGVAPD
jgi:hypothetical protein